LEHQVPQAAIEQASKENPTNTKQDPTNDNSHEGIGNEVLIKVIILLIVFPAGWDLGRRVSSTPIEGKGQRNIWLILRKGFRWDDTVKHLSRVVGKAEELLRFWSITPSDATLFEQSKRKNLELKLVSLDMGGCTVSTKMTHPILRAYNQSGLRLTYLI